MMLFMSLILGVANVCLVAMAVSALHVGSYMKVVGLVTETLQYTSCHVWFLRNLCVAK